MATTIIRDKSDTAANWTAANPTLLPGQWGVETDTGKAKMGRLPGVAWNSLAYFGSAGSIPSLPFRDPISGIAVLNNSATVTTVGPAYTSLDGSAAAIRTSASTDRYSRMNRNAHVQSVAAVDRMAGWSILAAVSNLRAPTAAINSGFRIRLAAAIGDANAAGQFAIGVAAAPPAFTAASEPSAMVNCIYLGGNVADANMSVKRAGASGPATGTALGASFPNHTNATNPYELLIDFRGNGSTRSLTWEARNLVTDALVTGSFPDDSAMPVAGTVLGAFIARGSAGVATAPVIEFFGLQVGPLA